MGDLNLSHRNLEDQQKIVELCQEEKINALHEITRSLSNNQLDYILLDKKLKYFVTNYNFISDHKTIVVRFGLKENELTDETRERLTFDQECHMKTREAFETNIDQSNETFSQRNEKNINFEKTTKSDETQGSENLTSDTFRRKFLNPDMTTCWLNSCLQLILTAMDYDDSTRLFNSELGRELLKLQSNTTNESLNPTNIKDILVSNEDIRIATRLSEISSAITNQILLEEQSRQIRNMRLDLNRGQQCVRDFFICLNENLLSWPDVITSFAFKLKHSTECLSCKHINQHETDQTYFEMPVPHDNSKLNDNIEEIFNEEAMLGVYCEDGCAKFSQKIKRTSLNCTNQAGFLIIILTRGMDGEDGFQLVQNETVSTNDIFIR